MTPISATIITFNEEKNIARCIDSVKPVADDIVVVDSFSTDATERICLEKKVRFIRHAFEGHIEQKNWAVTQAEYPHVFSLDADEALDVVLQQSILAVKEQWRFDGYFVNRFNNYCGRWIRHSGWYPDRKLRLWDSRKGAWEGENPHDRFEMQPDATTGRLKGNLLHYSYADITEHIEQIHKFSTIAAQARFKKGKQISTPMIVMRSWLIFWKKYFLKRGILDGYHGYVISMLTAYATFLKDIKLRELNKRK